MARDKRAQADAAARHYSRNKESMKARALAWTRQQRVILRGIAREAKNVPCADCGGRFPPWVMEFDHVRGDKEADVANAVHRAWSVARLLAELAKCEVVCANCHAERTHMRRVAGECDEGLEELPQLGLLSPSAEWSSGSSSAS